MRNSLIGLFSAFILFIGLIEPSSAAKKNKKPYIKNDYISVISSTCLPSDLEECSAVEMDANGSLWMINDSHNTNELFKVNLNGKIEKTIELNGVDNNDWEDLSFDAEGKLFVGDFGNNDNDRKDLAIYIVNAPDKIKGDNVTPEIIHFTLEDQQIFPPEDDELFFDIEAFFIWNEQIYLFTKDRSKPFIGLSKLYVLPAVPGNYKAKYICTYHTMNNFYEGAITSADISADGTKVVLLSNENIWLLTDFNSTDFISGNIKRLELSEWHQYEGIVFKDNNTLYLTNELDEEGEFQLQEISIHKYQINSIDDEIYQNTNNITY